MTMDLFAKAFSDDDEPRVPRVLTVGELTRNIKELIESGFGKMSVQGEVSNLTFHSSGHCYFTLKDEQSQIKCVLWRSDFNRVSFRLEHGMKVITHGRLSVYERGGYYQLTVRDIQPQGVGALQAAFEALKRRLFEEGWFDEQNKIEIPQYPDCVGVITSPTGAAIRDMVSVIRRRLPHVQIVLYPVRVQGEGAAQEIATAIREFDRDGRADVLIVGRGGGSLEDLWAFNEEIVARAIYECQTPIISAVGHEIDVTIADFVADVRAATPSAAAEIVSAHREELLEQLRKTRTSMVREMRRTIDDRRTFLRQIVREYGFRSPVDRVYQLRQDVDRLESRMVQSLAHSVELHRTRAEQIEKRLLSLNPRQTLARGYAIVWQNGRAVSRTDSAEAGPAVVEWQDGTADATLTKFTHESISSLRRTS